MKMVLPSKHISIAIDASPTLTYGYAANPENLPNWAAGLSTGIKQKNGCWVSQSPMGEVKVSFVERNEFGVLDHTVTLPDGTIVLNAMRIIPNGEGSEVVFSLFHRSNMSESDFELDARMIRDDLMQLKSRVEEELKRP
jgi:hypothetical protein